MLGVGEWRAAPPSGVEGLTQTDSEVFARVRLCIYMSAVCAHRDVFFLQGRALLSFWYRFSSVAEWRVGSKSKSVRVSSGFEMQRRGAGTYQARVYRQHEVT